MIRFFFADSQDLVDPSFDFETEQRSETRIRQQDDLYAHEIFPDPPYDGMLISRAIVEGKGGESGRYTLAQKQRLLRQGARSFLRLQDRSLEIMGDCGAFSYINEKEPPVTVDEVIDFYEACEFDLGVSVDHVILAWQPEVEPSLPVMDSTPEDWQYRQEITLEKADEFLKRCKKRKCRFTPVGVAQGWSPKSYSHSVKELQKMGYRRIGLGGLVPLNSDDLLVCVEAVSQVRHSETGFHLFGVTRPELIPNFIRFGVTSFDSTSPLKHAFKHDRQNYFTLERTYSAIRVPQVEGNQKLQKRITSGEVSQSEARELEKESLTRLKEYDNDQGDIETLLKTLREYAILNADKKDRTCVYREVLEDRPWKQVPCAICEALGIHVVLFRGAERNRRRGFHNLYVTNQLLHQQR